MKIEKAIKLLLDIWIESKDNEMVKDPVAYSLYKVWKMAEGFEKEKK